MSSIRSVTCLAVIIAAGATACERPDAGPIPPDYRDTWSEDRARCTLSHDHDLRYIRVYTDEGAHEPYLSFSGPGADPLAYPPGARLLKEEYTDSDCTELLSIVLMTRLEEGTAPQDLDWRWERFTPDLQLDTSRSRFEPERCIDCHVCHCGALPYGWQHSCSPLGLEPSGCAM